MGKMSLRYKRYKRYRSWGHSMKDAWKESNIKTYKPAKEIKIKRR